MEVPISSHPWQCLLLSRLLIVVLAILIDMRWYVSAFIIFTFLIASDFEHLVICLGISFMNCLFIPLVCDFSCFPSFYFSGALGISHLITHCQKYHKYLSQSVIYVYNLIHSGLLWTENLNFNIVKSCFLNHLWFLKSFFSHRSQRYTSTFSSIVIINFLFTCNSIILLNFSFYVV